MGTTKGGVVKYSDLRFRICSHPVKNESLSKHEPYIRNQQNQQNQHRLTGCWNQKTGINLLLVS